MTCAADNAATVFCIVTFLAVPRISPSACMFADKAFNSSNPTPAFLAAVFISRSEVSILSELTCPIAPPDKPSNAANNIGIGALELPFAPKISLTAATAPA